jgi:hypothetical protein
MEFETPREAILRAENARLKAENDYLRRALNVGGLTVTPIGVVGEERLGSPLPDIFNLPVAGSVSGNLSRFGNYHVLARLYLEEPEDLEVRYYAPADIIKAKAGYAINELFPYLHEQFIRALASALNRRRVA